MKADLHCHTTLSDGSLGIEEVIAQAKRKGLDCLSITDHDTLSSVSRASVLGQRYGIQMIPAVEFSAFDGKRGAKAHIICYNPKKPDRLEGLCLRTSESRKARGKKMAMRVIEKYPITLENIAKYAAGSKAVYKCHIMHALMDYGYTTNLYGDVYNELFNVNTGLCSPEVSTESDEYPEVRFVLQLIHSAGGTAVLAHPRVYNNFDLLEELAAAEEIDGVEVWHGSAKEGDAERLSALAEKYNLVTTGGSDFHGFYNHYPTSLGNSLTPEASLQKIISKKEAHV
ncbi:MAG: PHP domain-containing protein [Oscillospiraceae bacterium]|jgi:predicted metal-dependent phosphoesterase TrpH|nr:PHP domain-containing protein [Oscillospiraceae bacterium]